MADAERFAAEDKKKREAVDTKNQAESMIYQTEKQLDEFKEKVPDDVKVSGEMSSHAHSLFVKLFVKSESTNYRIEKQLDEFKEKVPDDVKVRGFFLLFYFLLCTEHDLPDRAAVELLSSAASQSGRCSESNEKVWRDVAMSQCTLFCFHPPLWGGLFVCTLLFLMRDVGAEKRLLWC